ncbi:MFS transporter [Streptomyces sp. NPDC058665]|uniref:MFS transporter n=1 Tax=Streptomyces sp. NPDC058665 TaxID=3346586 RepID=UPI00366093B2
MPAILREKNFRLFLVGDLLANFADFALWLAMAVWVKTLTGSTAAAGLVMFSFALGGLFLPLFGVLADRFPRKRMLITAHLVIALLLLTLVMVDSKDDVWMIYGVIFVYGLYGAFTAPAQAALLPSLVPREELSIVNGIRQSLHGALRLFTPAIGVGAFALIGGPGVSAAVSCVFVISALVLLPVKTEETVAERPTGESWWAEVSGGVRLLARTAALRQIVTALGIAMLALGFFEVIGIEVVTKGLGQEASHLGFIGATQGVGTIAGGITVGVLLRRLGEGLIVSAGLLAGGLATLLLLIPSYPAVLFAVFVLGVAFPALATSATTALQRQVPNSHLGRAFAAFEFIATVPQTVSMAMGALLISLVDYRVLVVVVSVVLCGAALYLASHSGQWALVGRERDEDAVVEEGAREPGSDSSPALPEGR